MAKTVRATQPILDQLFDHGWVLLQLTESEAEAIAAVVLSALTFFRLPLTEKTGCRIGPAMGFRPYGIEYSNSSDRPDEMETFSTTAASEEIAFPIQEAQELSRRGITAFNFLEVLAEELVFALAQRITDKSWETVLQNGLRQWSTLQINYSKPCEARSAFINEEHEDGHFLTLVFATSEGLEVRDRNNDLVPVVTMPGQVVAMLGGIASLMTDGRLLPLFHQVRPPRDCPERVSILFFADLTPELCQPWILGETNRSVDIGAHIRANPVRFGLQRYGSD